ncbi:MAG TPA: thymidine phosphorylase [Anaerolineae bacterium]|nr:thymidine phosphorylase [Anaerolineae bacterium]HQI85847.1 thymidine phosphorylase [Anaerolineae bacterium]
MRIVELIEKKRDGEALTTEEIRFFVEGYTAGTIPDYQAAALLMAIMLRGMDDRETGDLTLAMAYSGEVLDLKDVAPFVVDKHSTGGVGDKVSLVVAPTVAACGLPVGKMSGRGLGFSGGTLDKLESVPGYRADLSVAEFKTQLKEIGIVLTGQSANLAPADGKLYALRDVTGTVPSMPLITSSIMSKKIAAGADAIVLDVKVGSGAFMKSLEEARALADGMVRIGHTVGRKVTAVISDMNQPLGYAVGNILEVCEAIDTLHGHGPADFRDHCLEVAAEMLCLGGKVETVADGVRLATETIATGRAWEKFRQLIIAQGGDVRYVDDPSRFPKAALIETIASPQSGYLATIRADEIGMAALALGGGREKKGDPLDHQVGIVLHCKVGDRLEADAPLFTVHANDAAKRDEAIQRVLRALNFSAEAVAPLPLFYGRLE